jgi:hypothetical protein
MRSTSEKSTNAMGEKEALGKKPKSKKKTAFRDLFLHPT